MAHARRQRRSDIAAGYGNIIKHLRKTAMEQEALLYAYGIVPAGSVQPEEDLRGLDGTAVGLLPIGEVAAVIGLLPAEVYSDDALNARLDDLDWVGERGVAHERVLDWFAERGPIVPLSLFSLHRDAERLTARIAADAQAFADTLERLRGHREWGVKLWRRDAEAREGIDQLSPSLQALGKQIEEAPAGRRFLLERKREAMRAEEVRAVSARLAHELFAALRAAASDGAAIPIPPAAGGDRVLLLHAAFLVADDAFADFQRAITAEAGRISGAGFELEFTGPWPPYHFSDIDDG